jgi:hypothetical protein
MSHNEVGKYGTKSPLFEEKRGDFFEFEYLGGRKIFRIVVMGQPPLVFNAYPDFLTF